MYSLTILSDPPKIDQDPTDLLSQILSTFKFTTPTTSVDYSDWHTYEKENIYTYIQKIYTSNDRTLVDADYIELAPDSYMPFKVINQNKKIRTLTLSPNIEIYLVDYDNYGAEVTFKKSSVQDFMKKLSDPLFQQRIFRLSFVDNAVQGILEQFTP